MLQHRPQHLPGVSSVQVVIKDYRESEKQVAQRERGIALYARLCQGHLDGAQAIAVLPHKTDFVAVYRLFCSQNTPDTLTMTSRMLSTLDHGPMEHCRMRILP